MSDPAAPHPPILLPPPSLALALVHAAADRNLPAKIGDALTPQQYKEAEELGE